jgi:hypothetical protein
LDLILVEDYHDDVKDLARYEDAVVALTPEAGYRLEQVGVKYRIPDEYMVWEETDEYHRCLREWLDVFNDFLEGEFDDFRGLRPCVIDQCVTMLKNVIDPFTSKVMQFKSIVNEEQPSAVYYFISENNARDLLNEQLYFSGESILFKLFSADWGDHFPDGVLDSRLPWFVGDEVKSARGRSRLRDRRYVRPLLDIVNTLSFLPSWSGMHLLFANPIPKKAREAKLRGCKVTLAYHHLVDTKGWGWVQVPDELYGCRLFTEYLGIPDHVARRILHSRILYFVNGIIPQILVLTEKWKDTLGRDRPDYVLFRHRNHPSHYALFMACRQLCIPTVYVRHGWCANNDPWTDLRRQEIFDYYVAQTEEDKQYYLKRGWKCRIL